MSSSKARDIQLFCSIILLTVALIGCAKPSTQAIAQSHNFKHQYIKTSKFNLASYQKISPTCRSINVYLEGDGKVLTSRGHVAEDPSPQRATVMQLAALDPSENVVYLARPCQYSPQDLVTVCEKRYWTSARYSKEVVASINQALNQIKLQTGAQQLCLIGFSGGGALAVLVASERTDIACIRTIAGNLDLATMQNYHNASPLSESLDPLQVALQVKHIPQIHFAGAKDKIVPPKVLENFSQVAGLKPEQIHILKGVSHNDGWQEHWPKLLEYIP